jgi:hypothetical protein
MLNRAPVLQLRGLAFEEHARCHQRAPELLSLSRQPAVWRPSMAGVALETFTGESASETRPPAAKSGMGA